MIVATSILAAVVSFFLWAIIHESSHALAVCTLRPGVTVRMYPYPHWKENRFYFARVWWAFEGSDLTDNERAILYAAPRLPDIVGVIATVTIVHSFEPSIVSVAAAVLTGGSLVDLFVGSIGWNEQSDLKRVVRAGVMSVWAMRVVGMAVVTFATVLCLLSWVGPLIHV